MRLSVIIPAYNEAESLAGVVRGLSGAFGNVEDSFEIIVVDNGSTDETQGVLEKLKNEIPQLVVHRVFPNKGYGNGILEGLKIAKGDVLGWMHADDQLESRDVVQVYSKLQKENLPICKVTRVERQEHIGRIIQSRVYNAVFQVLFTKGCRDVNASPKLFLRKVYETMNLQSRDWFLDAEIIIKAIRLGYTIGEVPITWHERRGGKSKVKIGTSLSFIKSMFAYRFFK